LDRSKVTRANGHSHAGAVVERRAFDGARIVRIMHPPHQKIAAHTHDWPSLAIYRTGDYRERADDGAEIVFDGPSFVLQPLRAVHEDAIGASGLETVTMVFDPDWLGPEVRALLPRVTHWRPGGSAAMAARALMDVWQSLNASEADIRACTSRFLHAVLTRDAPEPQPAPAWGARVLDALTEHAPPTEHIAARLGIHPAWLARAYRAWRGEGIGETVRRKRVERAAIRLRTTTDALADIAADCAFCDQSHMNRAFRAVLGRTPLDVRAEAALLSAFAS